MVLNVRPFVSIAGLIILLIVAMQNQLGLGSSFMKKLALLAAVVLMVPVPSAFAAESGCSVVYYRYYAVQSIYSAAYATSDGVPFNGKHKGPFTCGASRNLSTAVAKSEALSRCAASAKKFKVANHCAVVSTHM
jgi:hypothetical protein